MTPKLQNLCDNLTLFPLLLGAGDMGNLTFYTREQWQARGEKYGNSAPLTVVIDDCPLIQQLADCSDDGLIRFVRHFGFYFELGYAWSMHFYPLEG